MSTKRQVKEAGLKSVIQALERTIWPLPAFAIRKLNLTNQLQLPPLQSHVELHTDRAMAWILSRILDFLRSSGDLDKNFTPGAKSCAAVLFGSRREQQHARSG